MLAGSLGDHCADNASMIKNLPTQYSHPWPLTAWLRAVMMSQHSGSQTLPVITTSDQAREEGYYESSSMRVGVSQSRIHLARRAKPR